MAGSQKLRLRQRSESPRYEVSITWSPEDQCYIAAVPELPGCMTHGATMQEAAVRAREAITVYIESLVARGLPVPVPLSEQRFSGKIPLRVDPVLHRNLAVKARRQRLSLNKYIESVLRKSA